MTQGPSYIFGKFIICFVSLYWYIFTDYINSTVCTCSCSSMLYIPFGRQLAQLTLKFNYDFQFESLWHWDKQWVLLLCCWMLRRPGQLLQWQHRWRKQWLEPSGDHGLWHQWSLVRCGHGQLGHHYTGNGGSMVIVAKVRSDQQVEKHI